MKTEPIDLEGRIEVITAAAGTPAPGGIDRLLTILARALIEADGADGKLDDRDGRGGGAD